jgi:hypothetical protein
MHKKNIEIKNVPTLNRESVGHLLQNIMLAAMAIETCIDALDGATITMNNTKVLKHEFKNGALATKNWCKKLYTKYETYYNQDDIMISLDDAVNNWQEVVQSFMVVPTNIPPIATILMLLYEYDRAKFNTLTANILKTPLL